MPDNNSQLQSRPKRVIIANPKSDLLRSGQVETVNIDLLASNVLPELGITLLSKITNSAESTEYLVTEMEAETLEQLRKRYGENLIIEEDISFELSRPTETALYVANARRNILPLQERKLSVSILVQDQETQEPVPNALVILCGIWCERGVTDINGRVTLEFLHETPDTLQTLVVSPSKDYWSYRIDNPAIALKGENIVYLAPLEAKNVGFPEQEVFTWGQTAMGFDQTTVQYRGSGIKIGVIDSGLGLPHQDLEGDFDGQDYREDPLGWRQDTVGHGTHVTGIMSGSVQGKGIQGLAPEASYYIYTIFEGGQLSAILQSLDQCIKDEVDLVNLSLGTDTDSELLRQKIQEVTEAGIACVAAAGNSASKIRYPAAYEEVLSVAAIGQFDKFPISSTHRYEISERVSPDEKYFAAEFTCFAQDDQRMDVCAPGVAILSTVPPDEDSYIAWDGTSMAVPHITGLAALILEAREDIRNIPKGRSRVEALFEAIRDSADDLGLPAAYQGRGLPNVRKALNLSSDKPGKCPSASNTLEQLENLLREALDLLED